MKNKIINLLLCLIAFSTGSFAYVEKLPEVSASFSIIQTDINLIKENTILDRLIKSSEQELRGLLNEDGTKLLSFKLKYTAPVELKGDGAAKARPITQYGLYNTLNPELKSSLGRAMESPINIKIAYDTHDPTSIQFIVGDNIFAPPVLVRDASDDHLEVK